ncbi:MAG: bacillithiol biosynthesis cysteine-adding enzyme BshC [Acidobacteria bacterium]|nr:bacillithiol biosynthesis cysteine-adding enzyme BshC [Acidobacteriota bacterium]MCI0723090.1 bacillithiol biosynthesis cysteine-adding enzyme BshC [Acidobacteriota bacterium]
MTRDRIHFKDLPKTSTFFLDYLHNFPKLTPFFPYPYALEHFRKEAVTGAPQLPHRQELCQILDAQNRAFGAGARTLENLEKLHDSDCWAVVTGQQVGLFTGPAYTIYKALTAVKLAAHYACRGIKIVPLFWMATEDHDLAEVDHCYLVDGDSHLQLIHYESGPQDTSKPVGKVRLSEAITPSLKQFLDALPNSEFKHEMEGRLTAAYGKTKTFAEAFGQILSYLFLNYGLVLVDPQDERLKQLGKPVFEKILLQGKRYQSLIQARSGQLVTAGYHAQVVLEEESTGLFFEDEGRRRALIRDDGLIKIKGGAQRLPAAEIQQLLNDAPWKFSPNVLFRPLMQDLLLPTLACVAGPSELAYLAQIGSLYEEFGRKPPVIFPRFSVSVIEKKIGKILEKYQLNFVDVFLGNEAVIKKVVEQNLDQSLAAKFAALEQEFAGKLAELEGPLKAIDQTLADALRTTQQKVQYQVAHLRAKFVHAETRHHETLTKQIDKALAILYPLKTLQERRINIFYFLARYGMDFLAQLYEEIDLTDPDHRLFFVS